MLVGPHTDPVDSLCVWPRQTQAQNRLEYQLYLGDPGQQLIRPRIEKVGNASWVARGLVHSYLG